MRILFINYSYSLSGGVNANRVYELLSYFANKKISVTHLTPYKSFDVKGVDNIVVTPSMGKPGLLYKYYFGFIKPYFSPHDTSQQEQWVEDITKYLKENQNSLGSFDIIYINTQPRSLCRVGAAIKRFFDCKIAVDFHDPFYYDPYRPNLPIFNFYRKKIEEEYFKDVDLLVVNTPSTETVYQDAYPKIKVKSFPNIIPQNLPEPKKRDKNKKGINILYGGSLYVGRDLFPLLKALKNLDKHITVEVLGDVSVINKFRYRQYPNIVWKNKIPREEYFNYLDEDVDIGVVLQGFNIADTGASCVAAKTYEYLGLNMPVIYVGPEGDNADIIRDYSTNSCVVTDPSRLEDLSTYLENFSLQDNNVKKSFYRDFSKDTIFGSLLAELKKLTQESR